MWFILSLFSAFTFSLRQISEKTALKKEHQLDFLAANSIFMFLLILPMIFLIEQMPMKIFFWIAFAMAIDIVAVLLLLKAIKEAEISSIAPIMNLSPIFVLFLGYIFLSESPTAKQLLGIIIVLFGVYIIILKKNAFSAEPKYLIYATITAFIFGCIAIIIRYVLKSISIWDLMFWTVTLHMVGSVLIHSILRGYRRLIRTYRRSVKPIALASVLGVISNFSVDLALSFPSGLAALVIPLRRTSTIFTALIGGRYFNETDVKRKVIACAVMLVGIFLIAI